MLSKRTVAPSASSARTVFRTDGFKARGDVKRNLHIILCACAIPFLAASSALGGAIQDLEYDIKAAYIYNFTKFVEWPEAKEPAQSTFRIGILGDDPFGPALDIAVIDKTAGGRRIIIERFPGVAAMRRSAHPIDIVFFGALPADSLEAALKHAGNLPILTIGETPGFCERGGIINLVIRKNRVRLEINRAAAEHAKLRISSKLLQLASRPGEME
jgi:hypothetical protein